jgi:hypothetical protein
MQFIKDGPDVPEPLLQAQEEGRVVFFCGAGISYPAKLPGFSGLVMKIYEAIGEQPNAIEKTAIRTGQFDTAIGLLEARIIGGRETVRCAVSGILSPDLKARGALSTHEALLTLGTGDNDRVRLVTTNFDRLFEEAIKHKGLTLKRFEAPFLPVPKNRWDGLVYLHGLIPPADEGRQAENLVLTSGDFGLAYLNERWAARFVSELFRTYTVCFIGYSIDDRVLRYMMDALAADRLLGEIPPEMFAFGSFSRGSEQRAAEEWQAKNVTPILYPNYRNHTYLHKTIRAWADTCRDGVRGRERIIDEYAMTRPLASTKQDDYVGRMLWALSHPSGLPAKRFANLDPVPSLDWLNVLSQDRFGHSDLSRFGVPPLSRKDSELIFSLMRRPAPYTHAPRMACAFGPAAGRWDDVMRHLAYWLTRHLGDPALMLWLVKCGGHLHDDFVWQVERRLEELAKWEREGRINELKLIRLNAPNAIPQPFMRILWRFLLTGRVKSFWRTVDLYRWKARLDREGLTATLRLELRELLSPKIALKPPFHGGDEDTSTGKAKRLKDLVDFELELVADHVHSSLNTLAQSPQWRASLPTLLDDFQQLLRDALDLMRELGEAEDQSDRTYLDMPSISTHSQNRGFRDWVALIELLRDAWLGIQQENPKRAARLAHDWFDQPYPTFKRLALFAATHESVAPMGEWVGWLLRDDGWWLWSAETQRETMRLLVLRGSFLPLDTRVSLESAILAGPPRHMFRDNIEPEQWEKLVARSVWLRLAKLDSSSSALGDGATAMLTKISAAHPYWKLTENQSDEFSIWVSGTGDPDYNDHLETIQAPRNRRELMSWLLRPPPFRGDDWHEICREKFPTAVCALCALAHKGEWPANRWREAMEAWNEEKRVRSSWRYIAPLLRQMPDNVLLIIAPSAAHWLAAASKVMDRHQAIFLYLCERFLRMAHEEVVIGDKEPFVCAINHPIGQITQALLNYWFRGEPIDDQHLPEDLRPLFTELCNTRIEQYRHARVLLALHVIALFRVDRKWTEQYLLPCFDWQSSNEARATWAGFLMSARLYPPLVTAFKTNFLETTRHYSALGDNGRRYAAILTYAALDPQDTFTRDELRVATGALPPQGLQEVAQVLANALENAAMQRELYWANRIQPYWKTIWPKSRTLRSQEIAYPLARLAIAAGQAFHEALSAVRHWIQPLDHPDGVVRLLQRSGLCSQFPQDALLLLDAIISDQSWAPQELTACLEAIALAWPEGARDRRYERLRQYLRR